MAQDQSQLPRLTQSRSGTAAKIANRVRLGEEIRDTPIETKEGLRLASREMNKWHSYNRTLLLQRFDTPTVAEEYSMGWVEAGSSSETLQR